MNNFIIPMILLIALTLTMLAANIIGFGLQQILSSSFIIAVVAAVLIYEYFQIKPIKNTKYIAIFSIIMFSNLTLMLFGILFFSKLNASIKIPTGIYYYFLQGVIVGVICEGLDTTIKKLMKFKSNFSK